MLAQQLQSLYFVRHLVFFDKTDIVPVAIRYILHIQANQGGGGIIVQLRYIQRLPVLIEQLSDVEKTQFSKLWITMSWVISVRWLRACLAS